METTRTIDSSSLLSQEGQQEKNAECNMVTLLADECLPNSTLLSQTDETSLKSSNNLKSAVKVGMAGMFISALRKSAKEIYDPDKFEEKTSVVSSMSVQAESSIDTSTLGTKNSNLKLRIEETKSNNLGF